VTPRQMLDRFALRLRTTARARGLKARHLALKVGVDPGQLSKWWRGELFPRPWIVMLLARELEVSPGWLLFGEEA
jgi:transcriptional regulator with XRE-family HTH domain